MRCCGRQVPQKTKAKTAFGMRNLVMTMKPASNQRIEDMLVDGVSVFVD